MNKEEPIIEQYLLKFLDINMRHLSDEYLNEVASILLYEWLKRELSAEVGYKKTQDKYSKMTEGELIKTIIVRTLT
jgi:hypothetical protein